MCTERKLERSGYVQGMNTIAGMLLLCMPEPDAFECLRRIVIDLLPLYFNHMNQGSLEGCRLVLATLRLVDNELYKKLMSIPNFGPVFFNQSLLSLMSVHPPLCEGLKMWDFFMAFGFGIAPVAVAATLISDRGWWNTKNVQCGSFKNACNIDANSVIKLTLAMVLRLPPDFLRLMLKHPRSFVDFSEFLDTPAIVRAPKTSPSSEASSPEKPKVKPLVGADGLDLAELDIS